MKSLKLKKEVLFFIQDEELIDINGGEAAYISTLIKCNGTHCKWGKPTNGGAGGTNPGPTGGGQECHFGTKTGRSVMKGKGGCFDDDDGFVLNNNNATREIVFSRNCFID